MLTEVFKLIPIINYGVMWLGFMDNTPHHPRLHKHATPLMVPRNSIARSVTL
jgi:hypothetical protein